MGNNVDYSAYEGVRVRGYTETVLLRGRVVVDKGAYVGRPGDGQFIKRGPYGGAYAPVAAATRGMPLFRAAGCGAEPRRVRPAVPIGR